MNKLLLGTALTALLLGACNKPAGTTAPDVAPASTDGTASATPAEGAAPPSPTPAPVANEGGVAPPASDDQAIDATIDSVLGDHARYRVVIEAYQKAVGAGDKEAVAALVRYPFEASLDGKKTTIGNPAGFVQNYDRIVTPAIAAVVTAQKYSELMVNQQGVMFGSGETWINGVCKAGSQDCSDVDVKIVAIQPGGSS